ncbi:MAG TPA: sorbosone dehydrogenase family protein [Terriglobales bacterium]|nr:sorbosone dehydrogenase family protein [Terriglobales bacterium]
MFVCKRPFAFIALVLLLVAGVGCTSNAADSPASKSPFSDYRTQKPGTVHKITPADLPAPYVTKSVDNGPDQVDRPAKAWPQVPAGFKVELFATGLQNPRLMRTAPNGDVFLAESRAGEIKVFRGVTNDGKAQQTEVYATGLKQPFGINFYPPGPNPQWVYVANTDSVVRFPYKAGDLKATGKPEQIADLPGGGRLRGGGHWTRDIVFSNDGKKMYVSVGSHSNVDDTDNNPVEHERAAVLEMSPDGSGRRIYASGIRNAVGIEVHPKTGQLWVSVNERDELGDNLPPEYITHVQDGGFYGWPWYYIGGNQDPRHKGKHPELKNKVIVPDVLVQPHNASLQMLFYQGQQFPAEYRGGIFAAQHGSWNKAIRTGYEVIFVPVDQNGKATGEYRDFMTGFVTQDGDVWGRPVGVAVMKDGSLLVSDDGGKVIWRVSYQK